MVEASLAGYDATGDVKHLRRARRALEWFFGRNLQGLSLYDPETGGCFDALMEGRVNENRGAESVVSLLLARLVMAEVVQGAADKTLRAQTSNEAVPAASGMKPIQHVTSNASADAVPGS